MFGIGRFILNKNLEDFLKVGKLYHAKMWDDQIGFFIIMLFLIAVQFLRTMILPFICIVIEIIILICCAKRENKPYGNVYCAGMHGVISMIVLWVNGWIFLSFVEKAYNILALALVGTIFYGICIYIRVLLVNKRIADGWYGKRAFKSNTGAAAMGGFFGIVTLSILRITAPQIKQNFGFMIIAGCFFIIDFLLIRCIDTIMIYYYFSRLSLNEQQKICGNNKSKNSKIHRKSVMEETKLKSENCGKKKGVGRH